MTDDRIRHEQDELDQTWDALAISGGQVLPMNPMARDINLIRAADDAPAPSAAFADRLEAQLATAGSGSREKTVSKSAAAPVRLQPEPTYERLAPPPVRRDYKWLSFLVAAALVIAMTGAFAVQNRFGGNDNDRATSIPAASALTSPEASPITANTGPSSADPGNTNAYAETGPSLFGIATGVLPVGINGMSVTDAAIVIEYGNVLSAYDPATLALRWSVELEYAVYSAPVVAGDAIYMGQTLQPEGSTEGLLGIDDGKDGHPVIENRLVAFSLKDGSALWSVDDAGSGPIPPVVQDGSVFSLGELSGNWSVYALNATDGSVLWISPGVPNSLKTDNSIPTVMPDTSATLAYGDGLVLLSFRNALLSYHSGTGEFAWSNMQEDSNLNGSLPVVYGDLVLQSYTQTGRVADNEAPSGGTLVANNVKTGEQVWSMVIESGLQASAPSTDGDIVAWTTWRWDGGADTRDATYHVANLDDGQEIATTLISSDRMFGGSSMARVRVSENSPTIAGGVAYVFDSLPTADSSNNRMLAIGAKSGEILSITLIDGYVGISPAMLAGNLLIASQVEGLIVFPPAQVDTGLGTPVATDLRTVNACDVDAMENPLTSGALDAATPVAPMLSIDDTIAPDAVPTPTTGTTPDSDTVDAITARFNLYQSCARGNDPEKLYGFFSTNYYANLVATGNETRLEGKDGEPHAPLFANSGEIQTLQTDTLVVLGENKVGGIVTGKNAPRFVIFVLENGEWRIDEWHAVMS